jgi:hypothetical protein
VHRLTIKCHGTMTPCDITKGGLTPVGYRYRIRLVGAGAGQLPAVPGDVDSRLRLVDVLTGGAERDPYAPRTCVGAVSRRKLIV